MNLNIGSSYPLFPRTGYVWYEKEAAAWHEEDLANWNLYFTLMGGGEIVIGNETVRTVPGELLLLPPKLVRRYRVADPKVGWGFYFLHFRPTQKIRNVVRWFENERPQQYAVPDPTTRNRITATLEEMFQINLRMPELEQRPALLDALLDSVLLRVASAESLSRKGCSGIDARIEKTIAYFHNHLDAPHSVDSLARLANLSRSQFCLLFRTGMGCSPHEYIEERRLELARFYLMTTAYSIGEIADSVGFKDAFYFSTRFKRRFVLSPSAFRQAGGKSPDIAVWTPPVRTIMGLPKSGKHPK